MSNTHATSSRLSAPTDSISITRTLSRRVLAALILPSVFFLACLAQAQVTMSPAPVDPSTADPPNLYIGANFSGVYPILQVRVVTPGGNTDPIALDAINLPPGVS